MPSYINRGRFAGGRRLWRWGLSLAIVLGIRPSLALSQALGSVRITVVDAASQRPIMGATASVAPGSSSGSSDTLGVAHVGALGEGLYVVTVRSLGYTPARQVNVRVTPGKVTIVSFQLERAAVTLATVPVTSDPFPRDPEQNVGRFTYTAR